MSALTFEQKIGFSRAPTSGWVLWHGGALGGAPDVDDGIHQRPGRLDAVAAVEERGVAADTVVQKRRVGAARRISKSLAIAEIHGDISDAHFRARALCAERNGNAFIGLDIKIRRLGSISFSRKTMCGARRNWIMISVLRLARRLPVRI